MRIVPIDARNADIDLNFIRSDLRSEVYLDAFVHFARAKNAARSPSF